MQIIKNPAREEWKNLTRRPAFDARDLTATVAAILNQIAAEGDAAVRLYAARFDGYAADNFYVTAEEFALAENTLDEELKTAIRHAHDNLRVFHAAQVTGKSARIETTPGVTCWRKAVAIEKVGLYIPGGTAPLFSTVLMLGVPAKLAGCREIILCTPPQKDGSVHPAILYAARLIGIEKVCKLGGVQAVGALAYGTESIPQVYKIFGPGNQYVTCAKQLVAQTGTAIDMPAGPSEVAIIADKTCAPAFVAADLLAQAEHGADSQVILLTNNELILHAVLAELETQLEVLPRRETAAAALENSRAILCDDISTALDFANEYAAEHLILACENAEQLAEKVINAGSVFIGNYACESAGDYASGTNHTLPTNGYARAYSGVSLDSFVKQITFQQLTADGVRNLGKTVEIMAAAEGLDAHRNAMTLRIAAVTHGQAKPA